MENEENNLIKKSLDEIISMANAGDADAMNELGYRYSCGEGVEKDKNKAFELYNSASQKGCIKAKFNLAMCYYNGNGTEKNETLSFNILKELAEKHNHYRSYYYLGEFYYWGGPVEVDYKKAFFYYNEALKINPEYLEAKFCIAYAYYSGKGIEKNYEIAFNMFSELVEKNEYINAYFYLGEFYYLGRVIQQDYEKALLYFKEALKHNKNVYASKYYLGEMYMLGKGVEIDPSKSKMYFEEILDEKHDDVYYKLALLYSGNFGLLRDENKIKEYSNKIEIDLCTAMIYYIIAIKPEEEQNLNEIFKSLDLERHILKETLAQFPIEHPAKIFYDRLSYLKDEEYNEIVKNLKSKIIKCKKEKTVEDAMMTLSSDNDVIDLAKCIVGYVEWIDKNIKKLSIKYGSYVAEQLIVLEKIDNIIHCNYKHYPILSEIKEEKKYCELNQKDAEYIYSLIKKTDFYETASGDYVLEGGGAGDLTIEYEDGTVLIKKLGSYMPEAIEELYQFIKNKLDSSNISQKNND